MEPEHIKERMTRIDSEGWTGTGKTREYIERFVVGREGTINRRGQRKVKKKSQLMLLFCCRHEICAELFLIN